MGRFDADPGGAATGLAAVASLAERHMVERQGANVAPALDAAAIDERVEAYDFARPLAVEDVAADLFDLLGRATVRSDSPRYFGLFNPPALPEAVAGDLIAAAVNPQLAVWSHAPAAAALERKLIALFGSIVGWRHDGVAGTFTSGGTEANFTACLAALARRYPGWSEDGLRAAHPRPTIYVSAEAHLAWIKIARAVGLGADAVRLVETGDGLRLTADVLKRTIEGDGGADPFLVVATAGTTAHGSIDDIAGLAALGRALAAHVHVDAAWAGAALLLPEMRPLFAGIEEVDSVTLDPHKWLSVPMGAGMYLARDWRPLERAFAVSTGYMPSASVESRDAYTHSNQWSRRFIGLKLFTALAARGLDGMRRLIRHQVEMGELLRGGLSGGGWSILNETPLPLVCFAPSGAPPDGAAHAIERAIVEGGKAWISTVRLRGAPALRACVTSYETRPRDVEALLSALREARATLRQ